MFWYVVGRNKKRKMYQEVAVRTRYGLIKVFSDWCDVALNGSWKTGRGRNVSVCEKRMGGDLWGRRLKKKTHMLLSILVYDNTGLSEWRCVWAAGDEWPKLRRGKKKNEVWNIEM